MLSSIPSGFVANIPVCILNKGIWNRKHLGQHHYQSVEQCYRLPGKFHMQNRHIQLFSVTKPEQPQAGRILWDLILTAQATYCNIMTIRDTMVTCKDTVLNGKLSHSTGQSESRPED